MPHLGKKYREHQGDAVARRVDFEADLAQGFED
jgi:hypothetical protein